MIRDTAMPCENADSGTNVENSREVSRGPGVWPALACSIRCRVLRGSGCSVSTRSRSHTWSTSSWDKRTVPWPTPIAIKYHSAGLLGSRSTFSAFRSPSSGLCACRGRVLACSLRDSVMSRNAIDDVANRPNRRRGLGPARAARRGGGGGGFAEDMAVE